MQIPFVLSSLFLFTSFAAAQTAAAPEPSRLPIIDVHLHALPAKFFGPPPQPNPVTGQPSTATTTEEILRESLAALERYNIVRAVTSGPLDLVRRWKPSAPDRLLPAPLYSPETPLPSIDELRQMHETGELAVLGELGLQYLGLTLDSPEIEPYLAVAEELDLPVALHTGFGPPGASYDFAPRFRAALGNPLLIEEALVRHPKLRVYLMHAGFPFLEETIALMHAHPQVYADLAVINWASNRKEFHDYLRRLMQHTECGLPKRLMFGSDQMIWPEAIGMAIEGIESADFLTEDQKRDIFCGNAARFLRLDASICE